MLDIEILRVLWWMLIGILLMGFAITDGFDFGVAMLMPLVAKDELEKRVVLNTIGPFWEGNQVWVILGAGAIFAAWPYVYAVVFSGFYLLVLLLLLTMGISRPVSFKYRSKLANKTWRRFWDGIIFIGGLVPAFSFGLLIGNTLLGVPFHFDYELRSYFTGSLSGFFSPFALWCGLTSVCMLVMHGGLYLAIKAQSPINKRALSYAKIAAILTIICFAIGGVWVAYGIDGYKIISGVDPFGYSNPVHKQIAVETGAWIKNYGHYPFSMAAPILGFAGLTAVILSAMAGWRMLAFICSALSEIGIIATVGVSMFPFILPSSSMPSSSLLVWDASSTQLTLMLMLATVIIFIPIIVLYTSWVYRALRGTVTKEMVEHDESHSAY